MEPRAPRPGALFERTDAEDVADEVAATRGLTMDERGEILVALCRLAAEQVSQHADPARTLAWQDPLSAETEALLQRLCQQFRAHA